MKNRRLTLFFVVMTLAVSPQVWQKLGNLLDAIQHRAHFEMLSLVLSPRDGEVESQPTSPMVEPQRPLACQGETLAQAQFSSQPKAVASFHKIKTERSIADASVVETLEVAEKSEKEETIALNLQAQDAQGETSPHFYNLAHESSKPPALRGVAFLPTNTATEKSNIAEAIILQQINSVAPVFVENINFQWKLKKALDENRSGRQKTRCPLNKSVPPLPSS
jgi:hypothetical protein